jgi:hypothetical protein
MDSAPAFWKVAPTIPRRLVGLWNHHNTCLLLFRFFNVLTVWLTSTKLGKNVMQLEPPAPLCLLASYNQLQGSRNSSVGIATGYGLDDQGGGSSSPGRFKNFHFSISSRPALRSTQPPIKWVPGVSGRGVKLTSHLQLVPRSRKCGSIHPLPYTSSWRNAYLTFTISYSDRAEVIP